MGSKHDKRLESFNPFVKENLYLITEQKLLKNLVEHPHFRNEPQRGFMASSWLHMELLREPELELPSLGVPHPSIVCLFFIWEQEVEAQSI